jgi:PTS system mannose-specific IID component
MRVELLLRSLLIQGSWNYRNLLGTGLGWALGQTGASTDATRTADGDGIEPAFNAHPYLATVAIGALTRASADGQDPERVRRFRDAIQSALGSLGDNLVWGAWRPFCVLAALLLGVLGGPAALVVIGLLLAYNAGNLGLRAWGLSAGLAKGLEVAGALRNARLSAKAERITAVGVLLTGFFAGILLGRVPRLPGMMMFWIAGGAALFSAGLLWGEVARRVAPVLLLLAILGGLLGPVLLSASLDG